MDREDIFPNKSTHEITMTHDELNNAVSVAIKKAYPDAPPTGGINLKYVRDAAGNIMVLGVWKRSIEITDYNEAVN